MFSEAKPHSTGPSGMVGVLPAARPQRVSPVPISARVAPFLYFMFSQAFLLWKLVFVQIWCIVNCIYFRYFLLCVRLTGERPYCFGGLLTKFSRQVITLWYMSKCVCVCVNMCACVRARMWFGLWVLQIGTWATPSEGVLFVFQNTQVLWSLLNFHTKSSEELRGNTSSAKPVEFSPGTLNEDEI